MLMRSTGPLQRHGGFAQLVLLAGTTLPRLSVHVLPEGQGHVFGPLGQTIEEALADAAKGSAR